MINSSDFGALNINKISDWTETSDVVTAVQFSTDGERLVSGNMRGEWTVYDTSKCKLLKLSTISCKNRKGLFSKGRKVISIIFTCIREALVTTADSRIRYIDLNTFKQVYKYKGHK